MNDFFANRECWFVGDFSIHVGEVSLGQIRKVLSNQALNYLRRRIKAVLIGPGAERAGRDGRRSLPEKAELCHAIVILGTCSDHLHTEVVEYAQRHGLPLLEHTAIADLVEIYFVPSAWEASRRRA